MAAPPSSIPGTGAYRFLRGRGPDDVEIAEADHRVLALLGKIQGDGRPTAPGARGAALRTIGVGGRNDACYRYACHIRARGGSDADVAVMTAGFNALFCSPPLGRAELMRAITSACAHEPGEDVAGKAAVLPDVGAPGWGEVEADGEEGPAPHRERRP